MASQTQQPEMGEVSLNPLGQFVLMVAQYGQNATNNISEAVTTMTLNSWLRLIVIVGGYMLLRPRALTFITRGAVKKMEEEDEREKARAQITPNELRGAKMQLQDQEDEDVGDGTGADWGQKARLRQREVLKQMLEAEERRREEEEEDKDIADLLED